MPNTLSTQLVHGMDAQEYHHTQALGSTSLRILSDPEITLKEAHYQLTTPSEPKPAYELGTLAHAHILEGTFDELVHRVDADNYRSKQAQQERDLARENGLIPLNNSEYDTVVQEVHAMADSVLSDPIAGPLVRDHEPELSLFWETDGVPLKARLDAWHQNTNTIVDLKTVRSARPNDFQKQISDLGYYIQARHYLNGALQLLTDETPDWYFVAIQKTPPYTVSVHLLDNNALLDAQMRIDYAIDRYKTAERTGWDHGYTKVFEQELTPWEAMRNETLDELQIELELTK
ncbi:PD-(D/E)XK nuclease-like domain-containing protein [Auritidibacter ignavus]|uniref:PD-(D/E)XK nuclease-like domain-containing protein n=1 Tax=Auritidibacter ignavus TaxID=678932 RepID=A0AAJ6AF53_9MICC|nr:PD-(D/E)XK nuclease-like domain-containing protein [Auritidibacter ignavus]WGH92118.1 PD-(D/E)XK nuclease-like domain-containing protein [Auritidibacter ignavus]